jgi:hypothetical protein
MGYQVDDPSLRPREFLEKSQRELEKIVRRVGEIPTSSTESSDHRPS